MCCGLAVGFSPAKVVENRLQGVRPGDDDADRNDPKIKQQAEIIQVAVIEWIFVVPFDFQGNAILEAIHRMGGAFGFDAVHHDRSVKFLLNPAVRLIQILIKPLGYIRLVAAAFYDVTLAKAEFRQDGAQIRPFIREICFQNCGSVSPFVDFKTVLDRLR